MEQPGLLDFREKVESGSTRNGDVEEGGVLCGKTIEKAISLKEFE